MLARRTLKILFLPVKRIENVKEIRKMRKRPRRMEPDHRQSRMALRAAWKHIVNTSWKWWRVIKHCTMCKAAKCQTGNTRLGAFWCLGTASSIMYVVHVWFSSLTLLHTILATSLPDSCSQICHTAWLFTEPMRCWHINVLRKTSASSSPNPVWRKTDYFFSACHSFCIGAEGTCYPEWSVDVMPRLKCVADLNDLLMIVPIFSTHVSIMNMDRWIGTHCIMYPMYLMYLIMCLAMNSFHCLRIQHIRIRSKFLSGGAEIISSRRLVPAKAVKDKVPLQASTSHKQEMN